MLTMKKLDYMATDYTFVCYNLDEDVRGGYFFELVLKIFNKFCESAQGRGRYEETVPMQEDPNSYSPHIHSVWLDICRVRRNRDR